MTKKDLIVATDDAEYIGKFEDITMEKEVEHNHLVKSMTVTVKVDGELYGK